MRLAAACVPGTLCDARVFAPLLARLDVDATHVPLTGRSVGDAAVALLAAAPPRFIAIGFSLGGSVVLEALRRAPDRLLGAVLIASHGEADPPQAATERARQHALFAARGATALIDDLWPRYDVDVAKTSRTPAVRALVEAMAQGFDLDAYAAQSAIAASRPDRLRDGFAPVPMLIVGGLFDGLCPPARLAASAAALDARCTVIDAAGHFLPLEQPDATAGALRDWFEAIAMPKAALG